MSSSISNQKPDPNAVDDYDPDDEPDEDEVEVVGKEIQEGTFKIRPSGFRCVPPTVYVDYPPDLGIVRNDIYAIEPLKARVLHFKCHWERICIKNGFQRAGFVKSDVKWTALWSKHQTDSAIKDLNCLQKINHFPGSWCVGRKDRLLHTISAMKRLHGNEFDFHPDGFVLPQEHDGLMRLLQSESMTSASGKSKKNTSNNLWIFKPVAASQGKGIKVITSQQVHDFLTAKSSKNKSALIQRYLHNPYLINNHKFDLRIYVLVTGVDPLRVYIHEEGLTRISTVAYSLKNTKNRFAHLTNYSINKKSPAFVAAGIDTPTDDVSSGTNVDGLGLNASDVEGFKWSLTAFRKWLSRETSPDIMKKTFEKIDDLVVKTMIAAEAEITPRLHNAANYRTNCFELFGLDVILNNKLEPQLLEVNISPSLMGSSPLDKKIKGILVADILHVVGMYPHDENWLKKINHIDEVNNRSTMGSSSVPPKSPRNNGKRTRSLSRGAEKQLSSTGGSVNSGKRTPNRSRERESGLNKSGNHTHRSASVPLEPGKEKPASSDTNASSNGLFNFLVNPFEFNSLSVLMSNQDSWRKNPCPETVDFNQFKSVPSRKMQYDAQSRGRILSRTAFVDTPNSNAAATDSIWIIILMIEDEMARASRSQFRLLHPTPKTVVHYLGLYRSARFSDHLIGKWVLSNGMHGPLSGYVPSKFLYTSNTSDSNSKKSASSTNSPTKSPPSKVDSIRTPNNTVKSSAMKQKLMQEVMSSRSNSKNNTDDVGTVNTSGTRRSRKSLIDEAPTRIVVNNKSPNSKCSPGTTAGQSEIHRRGLFAAECANLDTNIDDNNDKSPSRYSGDIIYSPIEKTKKVYSFNGNEDAEFVYEKDESGVTSVESLRKRMEHINLINQDYEMKYTTHTDNVSVGSNTRTKKSGTQKNVQPSFVTNNGRLGTGSAGKFESSFTQAAMSMAEVPHPYRLMPGSDSIKSIKASNQSSAASIGTTSSKGQPQGEDASSGLSISGGRPPSATNSRPSNSAVRNRPTSSGTSNTANYAADTSNSRKKANERNGEVHVSPVNVATGINVVSDNARNQLNRLQIQTNGQSTIRMAYGANPS